MAKVRLLNDGYFYGLRNVKFPVIVDGDIKQDTVADVVLVGSDELHRIGCDMITSLSGGALSFFIGTECELVDE